MGGHGAWQVAVNSPDLSVCVSPSAGWIRKEEYNVANSFFELDMQNTFVNSGILISLYSFPLCHYFAVYRIEKYFRKVDE
jgi:hypothetical protein